MTKPLLKKITKLLIATTPILTLAACNSGVGSNNSSATTTTTANNAPVAIATQSTTVQDVSPISGGDSCLKATLTQSQKAGNLTTSVTLSNSCAYSVPIGGYQMNLASEYTDETPAQLNPIVYYFKNSLNHTRNYPLTFAPRRHQCVGVSGSLEMINGIFNAKEVPAGGNITLTGNTALPSGKTYDLKLAKASFRVLTPEEALPSELSLQLTDPEYYNYSTNPKVVNPGRDSLSNVPVGNFGLKTVMLTNVSCNRIESMIPDLKLPPLVKIVESGTTCKSNGTQTLNAESSCQYLLRYDPINTSMPSQQVYESTINITAYAKLAGSKTVLKSNTFKAAFSSRSQPPAKQQLRYNELGVVDKNPTGLQNISVGRFGLKTYTITNKSVYVIESIALNFAPIAKGLPSSLTYDTTRSTCKTNGTQLLFPKKSCNITIKYNAKIQGVNNELPMQVSGDAPNGGKQLRYLSSKYLLKYSTANNNKASILNNPQVPLNGMDVDPDVTGLSFKTSVSNVAVGFFGLKAYLLTNYTGENLYNLQLSNYQILKSLGILTVDPTRSTCKFGTSATIDTKFSLKPNQSCLLVFKYAPIATNKIDVSYPVHVLGFMDNGRQVLNQTTILSATYRR